MIKCVNSVKVVLMPQVLLLLLGVELIGPNLRVVDFLLILFDDIPLDYDRARSWRDGGGNFDDFFDWLLLILILVALDAILPVGFIKSWRLVVIHSDRDINFIDGGLDIISSLLELHLLRDLLGSTALVVGSSSKLADL